MNISKLQARACMRSLVAIGCVDICYTDPQLADFPESDFHILVAQLDKFVTGAKPIVQAALLARNYPKLEHSFNLIVACKKGSMLNKARAVQLILTAIHSGKVEPLPFGSKAAQGIINLVATSARCTKEWPKLTIPLCYTPMLAKEESGLPFIALRAIMEDPYYEVN